MAERVAVDHVLAVVVRAVGEQRVDRQRLLGRGGDRARRKPFICDGSAVPSAPSTQPPLAFGAYQSGATRTVQISVTPAATRSLVDRLQTFASRKGFKAWQAGSVERRDVSLALRRDEILTVAAGDDTGLWRVALYRRMPPPKLPSDLPSEESVDALLREVRNELGELPGVRFVD